VTDVNLRSLMSDVKFFEGYSRFNNETQSYESWEQAVERVMNTHRQFYKDKLTPQLEALISDAEGSYKAKHVLGAQRALQFGGEQLLRHQMRLYNCTSSYCDRPEFFGEFFYILLCGAGAGFSVQKHHVDRLPMIRPRTKQPKTFVIPDSIEGWAQSLDILLSSFFMGGGKHPEYEGRRVYFDSTQIREKGAPISGGFKAPGPEPLVKALSKIERLLTNIAEEGRLRPIDCYDICMHASDAVLAGGVRRAATICLFSHDDDLMLTAKTGNWFNENPQRARSNNSAVLIRKDVTKEQFDSIIKSTKQFGEPGFVFSNSTEHCYNPCVEIGMLPQYDGKSGWQGCNLVEINGSHCTSKEKFLEICRAASILGTLQAGYTDFKFLDPISKKIFDREALLGVSITGWVNSPDTLLDEKVLKAGVKVIKEMNELVSSLIGINPSARLTCVKPAGNASVLLETASGVHDEPAPRYFRNVQINKMNEVCDVIKKLDPYMIEESVWSSEKTDYVISFPIIPPKGSLYKKDISAIDLLDRVKFIQKHWVEEGTVKERCVDPTLRHNVSNTINVKEDEWEVVAEHIFKNREYYAGISLLASSGDKDYYQAPFTAVLTSKEIVKEYGDAALFASGLIVDAATGFKNLWDAVQIAEYNHDQSNQELKDIRADWVRRFKKFADTYFDGDLKKTGYCLKDVWLLHKWNKIQTNYVPVNLVNELKIIRETDINTMGAQACAAGGCEL
jgi:ribonucleoside-triphosphate reductase